MAILEMDNVRSHGSELRRQIAQLFTEQLSVEVPTYDTDLLDSGVLDSLKFVELLVHLEREFGTQVQLNEFEWDNFRSIDRIAQFVIRRSVRETTD
jgi:acyl carrier protein